MKRESWSKKKRALYIRRIAFVIAILIIALIQNTPKLFPTILGFRAFLLIPLVICIAMFEKDLAAALMGALAGALWDITSATGDGFNALILMLLGAATSLLISYIMRNNLATALLLGGMAIAIYILLHWFFFVICSGAEGGFVTLFTFYLPSLIYSFIFVPIFYIILRSFIRKIND